MKKLSFTGTFVAVLISLLTACGGSEANLISIEGQIEGVSSGDIVVMADKQIAVGQIDSVGNFAVTFEYDQAYPFTLRFPGTQTVSLFLEPGDKIEISAVSGNLNQTFSATGDKASEAVYLQNKKVIMTETGIDNMIGLVSKERQSYFETKDLAWSQMNELLSNLKSEKGVSKEFVELEKLNLEMLDLYLDFVYPNYQRSVRRLSRDEPVDFPEDELQERIESADFNNPLIVKTDYGFQLLDIQLNFLSEEIMANSDLIIEPEHAQIIYRWMAAEQLLTNGYVIDYAKFSQLERYMEYGGPSKYKVLYEQFLTESKTPELNKKVLEIVDKWQHLEPGTRIPDFTFTDIEGNEKRLSELEGKIVYIDVWATWCGPCLAEHPNWSRLVDEYSGTDVEFLAVSIDNTREPWERMVKGKDMPGINWYADNAWQSDLAEFFMIKGIPRFLLLDRERRIIDPSAPRPSGNIRDLLNNHL